MISVRGGYSLVEYADNVNFLDSKDITHILKGTKFEPITAQDDYGNGLAGATGKSVKMLVRSANFDPNIYAALKAAELAHTKLYFRFFNGVILLLDDCVDAWTEYMSSYVSWVTNRYNVAVNCPNDEKFITQGIGPLNLTSFKYLRVKWTIYEYLWGHPFHILLDDTPLCTSPLETLELPTQSSTGICSSLLTLSNPSNLQSIRSVGAKDINEGEGYTFHFNLAGIEAIQNVVTLKNIIPTVETETNEFGKFNAMRIQGIGAADTEANLMDVNI
jgi:hypothetical protein